MIREPLRKAAPDLSRRVDELTEKLLAPLLARLKTEANPAFRPKQVNDPIWGTIELLPWEVALLDTPLWQRMRGVRQLGLAQLVFPGACHDRLEHILGVVGSVDIMLSALDRQVEQWNRDNPTNHLPRVGRSHRHGLRLAALFHDLGHGPFSHALEPVLEREAVLRQPGAQSDEDIAWRGDFEWLRAELERHYQYNSRPPISELIAVMVVLSDSVTSILADRKIKIDTDDSTDELQDRIVAAITGAVEGPGADHLSAVISGQIDADKLDYLQRDAHHAGLEIGFDVDRLLSRVEVIQVREDNISASMADLRTRIQRADRRELLQLGIAASGFGSFEQMLIGRTFLYDRLYHHHKVRAAEAMAQRLILVAERDRPQRFGFEDLFVNVGDEAFLRIFSGELRHDTIGDVPPSAAALANGILERNLLHRAFALRGRFISVAPDVEPERADVKRHVLWRRVVGDLRSLKSRYELGAEIHEVATSAAKALADAGTSGHDFAAMHARLKETGPDQIIVDLPGLKAETIRILARYPNGTLRVPEFSFNPYKWSKAYELQKRTAYVFARRELLPIVALAAKIVFFGRYGIVLAAEADGFIKAGQAIPNDWVAGLRSAGLIDTTAETYLTVERRSLVLAEAEDLKVPQDWLEVDEDFGVRLARRLNERLTGGLSAAHLVELGNVLSAMWKLVDHWMGSGRSTQALKDEAALQNAVRALLEMSGLKVTEGAKAGGGEYDLFANDAMLIENKFEGASQNPEDAKAAAGMQGRRYAIALNTQVVIVIIAYRPAAGDLRDKTQMVTVERIEDDNNRRVEIRFMLPYGAPVPSREKAAISRTKK